MNLPCPAISQLPGLVSAEGWSWRTPIHPGIDGLRRGWWIGGDGTNEWLFKMRPLELGYREHSFSSLAQEVGVCSQSSVFVRIPTSAPLHDTCGEIAVALFLFSEHLSTGCSTSCPMRDFFGVDFSEQSWFARFQKAGIQNSIDLIRGQILGYLCGQFEPPGHLVTADHRFVQIDNELMFSLPGPVNPFLGFWRDWEQCSELVLSVCAPLAALTDERIIELCTPPCVNAVLAVDPVVSSVLAARNEARQITEILAS